MYDVIVVGARCAGAPTAMLLGRKGHKVLLLDRSTFPSDLRQSTLLIHQPGVSGLEQWACSTRSALRGRRRSRAGWSTWGRWYSRARRRPLGRPPRASLRGAPSWTRSCSMLPSEPRWKRARAAPDLGNRVRSGTRMDDFVGGYARNFFRKPYGDGWALVGDAGACYEFTSAHGITNAFRQAAQIAEAVSDGLAGKKPMAEALSDFEQRRNAVEAPSTTLPMSRPRSSHHRPRRCSCSARSTGASKLPMPSSGCSRRLPALPSSSHRPIWAS